MFHTKARNSMGPIDAVDMTHRATIEGFEAEPR